MQGLPDTRAFLGVPVAVCNREQAASYFDEAVAERRLLKIAFANAHTLNVAARDAQVLAELQGFCILNDGIGLDVASRIKFGQPFPENLNGTDFMPFYLARSRFALRLYLLGGTPDVVEAAAKIFGRDYPGHSVVGFHHGYLESGDDARICAAIASIGADVVLVSMGNPLQELWIAKNGAATGAKLLFGVGALFDFVSGRIPRAPQWVRSLRCEWVYRLAREPGRLWRRYLTGNASFLRSILIEECVGHEKRLDPPDELQRRKDV